MATVLVSLKVFIRRRATIESFAPVSSTARKTLSPTFTRIQETHSSSSELPPYSLSGNFTPTFAAMSDLAIQANHFFLELDSSGEAFFLCRHFLGSPVAGEGEVAGALPAPLGVMVGGSITVTPSSPPLPPLSPFLGFLQGV